MEKTKIGKYEILLISDGKVLIFVNGNLDKINSRYFHNYSIAMKYYDKVVEYLQSLERGGEKIA